MLMILAVNEINYAVKPSNMKKFVPLAHWTTDFANEGVFDDLNRLTAFDEWNNWPTCEDLATLLPYEVKNLNDKKIEFVPQKATEDFNAVAYEAFIYDSGQVPTREKSWHDIFGALTWSLFPKTKALINKLHVDDIKKYGTVERTTLRNALTLFDECGVVLVTKNKALIEQLKNHQWQDVFVNNRALWHKADSDGIGTFQFGHANYEMLTRPYIGLTGKWLVIEMSAELLGLPLNVQYRMVDDRLMELIGQGALNDNSQLFPLPLLGVPNWFAANKENAFYLNENYFRPKPVKS